VGQVLGGSLPRSLPLFKSAEDHRQGLHVRRPSPHRTDCCRSIPRREGAQGTARVYASLAPLPVLVVLRSQPSLDTVLEAYHNLAAVWWGALAPSLVMSSWTRRSPVLGLHDWAKA
jgi:hypothetical protein